MAAATAETAGEAATACRRPAVTASLGAVVGPDGDEGRTLPGADRCQQPRHARGSSPPGYRRRPSPPAPGTAEPPRCGRPRPLPRRARHHEGPLRAHRDGGHRRERAPANPGRAAASPPPARRQGCRRDRRGDTSMRGKSGAQQGRARRAGPDRGREGQVDVEQLHEARHRVRRPGRGDGDGRVLDQAAPSRPRAARCDRRRERAAAAHSVTARPRPRPRHQVPRSDPRRER